MKPGWSLGPFHMLVTHVAQLIAIHRIGAFFAGPPPAAPLALNLPWLLIARLYVPVRGRSGAAGHSQSAELLEPLLPPAPRVDSSSAAAGAHYCRLSKRPFIAAVHWEQRTYCALLDSSLTLFRHRSYGASVPLQWWCTRRMERVWPLEPIS